MGEVTKKPLKVCSETRYIFSVKWKLATKCYFREDGDAVIMNVSF
jgi:hypothetical protein